MTAPFYDRKDENHLKFLRTIEPVFTFLNSDGTPAKNDKYDKKGIIIALEGPDKVDPALIKAYYDDTFVPALQVFGEQMNRYPSAIPSYNAETNYHLLTKWTDILDKKGVFNLIKFECIGKGREYKTTEDYLKAHKDHLYSFWAKGELPHEIILKYHLTAEHLAEEDIALMTVQESEDES